MNEWINEKYDDQAAANSCILNLVQPPHILSDRYSSIVAKTVEKPL